MKPEIEFKIRIGGQYRVVLNEGTDREVDTGWMKNMVLDSGLDMLGAPAGLNPMGFGSVGTGATAVNASQTSLVTHLASKAGWVIVSQSNVGSPTYAGTGVVSCTFAQGAVVGNITELGLGRVTGGSQLFSRCLILDGSGVPTALTVGTIDQLTLYYKITITPVITDITGSLTVSGTSYTFTARLANATSFCATLITAWLNGGACGNMGNMNLSNQNCNAYPSTTTIGAITSTPSGTAVQMGGTGSSASLVTAYVAGNFYNDVKLIVAPANGNATGGIKGFLIGFGAGTTLGTGAADMPFQYVLNNPIPKDNTKTLTIGWRFSWSR